MGTLVNDVQSTGRLPGVPAIAFQASSKAVINYFPGPEVCLFGRKYSAKNYVVQALAGMQRLSSGAGRRVYVTICFN
jgi:hypothetical protein